MNVLAIGAHPDDLELQCGGTLRRFVDSGDTVVMCNVTDGGAGGYSDPSEIAGIRSREAAAAAGLVGADHVSLHCGDGGLSVADEELLRLLVVVIRDAGPDLVITHAPTDYHEDHNAVSRLSVDATLKATIPLYDAPGRHVRRVAPLYFMDTVTGVDFQPQEYVDISSVFDVKLAMVSAHVSQVAYLHDHYGLELAERVRTVGRYRGLQCGVEYAEAFAPLLRWPRIRTGRLLP